MLSPGCLEDCGQDFEEHWFLVVVVHPLDNLPVCPPVILHTALAWPPFRFEDLAQKVPFPSLQQACLHVTRGQSAGDAAVPGTSPQRAFLHLTRGQSAGDAAVPSASLQAACMTSSHSWTICW